MQDEFQISTIKFVATYQLKKNALAQHSYVCGRYLV